MFAAGGQQQAPTNITATMQLAKIKRGRRKRRRKSPPITMLAQTETQRELHENNNAQSCLDNRRPKRLAPRLNQPQDYYYLSSIVRIIHRSIALLAIVVVFMLPRAPLVQLTSSQVARANRAPMTSSSLSSLSPSAIGLSTSNVVMRRKRTPIGDQLGGRASQAGDLSRVVAVSGQTIEFQCPLANELLALASEQHYTNSSDHYTIIWRKDGTLLNQLNPRLRLVQPQTGGGGSQASGVGAGHQQAPPRSSLTIQQARAKLDEASYECQLIKAPAPVLAEHAELPPALKAHKFQLKLLVAPRLAPFEFPQDAQVGQRILLTCSALEGQRPISFVWLKDNQIIQSSAMAASLSGASASVAPESGLTASAAATLGQLHRRQLADKFTQSSSADAPESGPTASKSPAYVLVERAEPSPAEHADEGTRLSAAQLSDAAIRVRQTDDYSILAIESLELKHAGRYTCSAQNEAERVAHSAQLAINAPPTMTIEPKDGDLVSGQSTVIECAAAGQPRPSLSWSRARESSGKQWDFVPIYENLRYSILPNGSLSITNVTQREQGFYMCTARNGFGPEVTKLIKITVHEPARISAKYKSVETRVDERAQLTCSASGEQPVSLTWHDKDGKQIDKQDKRFVIDELDEGEQSEAAPNEQPAAVSRLIVAKSTRSDSGHYTCQARNKHGQDKMILNLLVLDVPNKLIELKATNTTSTTISLRWQLGFTGNAPITSYLVQYQSDDPLDDLLLASQREPIAANGGGQSQAAPSQATSRKSLTDSLAALLELEPDNGNNNSGNNQRLAGGSEMMSAGQSQLPATASGLKAALEALNSALSATRLKDDQKNSTGNEQSNLATAVLDEAIDRTLVELTVEQSATHLVIKDLSPYCVYRLRVAGINKIGLGEFSDWIRVKTEEAPPSGSALKLSAAATGPNSVKLSWLPPERRSWNGQLTKFNIGYRPLDSSLELNKTVEWTPPSLALSLLDGSANTSAFAASSETGNNNNKPNSSLKGTTNNSSAQSSGTSLLRSPYALKQHLRQLLALQQQELGAHLTNLQRSTTYLVWLQAANSRGFGPQSHVISVKTLDDVPPSAPEIRIQSTSHNSITITWSMLSNFISSANQYSLFYRRVPPLFSSQARNNASAQVDNQLPLFNEPGPFIERSITSQQLMQFSASHHQRAPPGLLAEHDQQQQQQPHYQQFVYSLDQLDCGSVYELYMTTRNSVGKSEPSPVVATRTQGEPPFAPASKNDLFARIGSQDVLLNLAAWSTGGCPMTHISVRYKQVSLAPTPSNNSLSPQAAASSSSQPGWPISTSVPAGLIASINQQQQQLGGGGGGRFAGAPAAHLSNGDPGQLDGSAPLSLHSTHDQAAPFALKNLQPSTGYELELVAHNSAGHTTAQYEFVTAGPNGSRSGYTRREGVYRLDARGRPLESLSHSAYEAHGQPQLLPASPLDQSASRNQPPMVPTASQQLVPLMLAMLCLACLVVSSTFCYYRLAAVLDKRRRRSSSNQNVNEDDATSGAPASPSSTLKSAVGDWRAASQHNVLGATGPLRRLHGSHLHRYGTRHEQALKPSDALLLRCGTKPSPFISQSLSMRDLQLGAGFAGSATLKLKPATCRIGASKLSAATIARAGNGRTLFDSSPGQASANYENDGRLSCGQASEMIYTVEQTDGAEPTEPMCQQHETSWNSAQPQQVMPPLPPAQMPSTPANHHQHHQTTYAIPTATGQCHLADAYQDSGQAALIYQQQQQQQQQGNNETYGGIDACIQHLLMGQQQHNGGQQQQQYAMLLGQKATCNYAAAAHDEHDTSKQLNCLGYALNAARSAIDSSSGSSSGFGGDHSLQHQHQEDHCGSGAHKDCASSIVTGLTGSASSSNRSECLFGDNSNQVQYLQNFQPQQQQSNYVVSMEQPDAA